MASRLDREFIAHCDKVAQEIAESMVEEIHSRKLGRSERESLISTILADELRSFFYNTIRLNMADPDGVKWLNNMSAIQGGRVSGDKRWNKSLKQKFLLWALIELQRNPKLSKNAAAAQYAKTNPGTSAATLRRYLAEIPNSGDD